MEFLFPFGSGVDNSGMYSPMTKVSGTPFLTSSFDSNSIAKDIIEN
jgi:hypothetical protein